MRRKIYFRSIPIVFVTLVTSLLVLAAINHESGASQTALAQDWVGKVAESLVEQLYCYSGGCLIRLEHSDPTPKDGYFHLKIDHPNYDTLFSIAMMACELERPLRIRTRDEITNDEYAEVQYFMLDLNYPLSPPRVERVEPSPYVFSHNLESPIWVTFGQELDPATVTADTFIVKAYPRTGERIIEGRLEVLGGGKTVVFIPDSPYPKERSPVEVVVELVGTDRGDGAITNRSGVPIDGDEDYWAGGNFDWIFYTPSD